MTWDTTIVIPVRNREGFLRSTISSGLLQTVSPREILVVDDGSSDASADIAAEFGPPVRLIRLGGPGSGPAPPRNVGIRSATTEYITFLDSDDRIEPELLRHVRDAAAACPAFGLVACNWTLETQSASRDVVETRPHVSTIVHGLPKSEVLPQTYLVDSDVSYAALLTAFYLKMNGTTVRRSILLQEVGLFDETLSCGVDLDLWLRILRKHPLVYVDRPLQTVVRHADNLSSACAIEDPSKTLGTLRTYANLLEREYTTLNDQSVKERVRAAIADMYLSQGFHYRKQGDLISATSAIRRAIRFGAPRGTACLEFGKALLTVPAQRLGRLA
jgi:glycosyltransferase involved in cell wall biosynthesis